MSFQFEALTIFLTFYWSIICKKSRVSREHNWATKRLLPERSGLASGLRVACCGGHCEEGLHGCIPGSPLALVSSCGWDLTVPWCTPRSFISSPKCALATQHAFPEYSLLGSSQMFLTLSYLASSGHLWLAVGHLLLSLWLWGWRKQSTVLGVPAFFLRFSVSAFPTFLQLHPHTWEEGKGSERMSAFYLNNLFWVQLQKESSFI